jgi:hypothetical protein
MRLRLPLEQRGVQGVGVGAGHVHVRGPHPQRVNPWDGRGLRPVAGRVEGLGLAFMVASPLLAAGLRSGRPAAGDPILPDGRNGQTEGGR